MRIDDITALKKWKAIPKDIQKKITENVYCSNCRVTTITNYSITEDEYGILLKGECKKCGKEIARLLEDF